MYFKLWPDWHNRIHQYFRELNQAIDILLYFYTNFDSCGMFSKRNSKFQSTKMQKNIFYQNNDIFEDQEYERGTFINGRAPFTQKNNILDSKQKDKGKPNEEKDEQPSDLEQIWNSIQDEVEVQNTNGQRNKIKCSIMHVSEQPLELTNAEYLQIFELDNAQKKEVTETIENDIEDLQDLWNQVDNQNKQQPSKEQKLIKSQDQQKKIEVDNKKVEVNDLVTENSNYCLNYGKDYLIYDYQRFAIHCFETNVHSFFGFYKQENKKNSYHLYELTTNEPLIQCFQSKFIGNGKNESQNCLKFRTINNNQIIGEMFQKKINNGIIYTIKLYNNYQNKLEDSLALIQITDGYIGSNCYCNTAVSISHKYTHQSGQLKMIIGLKNGYLIANMGVNGVKSSPYNCRLENNQNSFVYLLGLMDKQSQNFIVRVGEGMSPLIALAISVGRTRYIDSFIE